VGLAEGFGWIAAIAIGISLGLLGGGGSILTVPVLAYLFAQPAEVATGYSLFIVGISSLIGAMGYLRRHEIHLRAAALFAVPSMLGAFLVRLLLLPMLPDPIAAIAGRDLSRGSFLLILFALLMLIVAFRMIRGPAVAGEAPIHPAPLKVAATGLAVGSLAGLLGAGGGFLIVPALVLLTRLPMRMAIGSSLLIIAVQSLVGFSGDLLAGRSIDWPFLLSVTGIAVAGVLVGSRLGKHIPGARLRPAFGVFVLVMAILMLGAEVAKL
jgi:uncharacterized protein